jgi:hypothetical protein
VVAVVEQGHEARHGRERGVDRVSRRARRHRCGGRDGRALHDGGEEVEVRQCRDHAALHSHFDLVFGFRD